MILARRLGGGPIIQDRLCASLGGNINGPSLVRRPDWAPGPGRYMLYFAHHMGRHIRLAFADALTGPWQVHTPGVLPLGDTPLAQTPPAVPQPDWAVALGVDGLYPHLASPDVHLNHQARRFEMLFHGLDDTGAQVSYCATSADGLDWAVAGAPFPQTYLRRFDYAGRRWAIGHGGQAVDLSGAASSPGPFLLGRSVRHCGGWTKGNVLHLFYSRIGDAPERILHRQFRLAARMTDWVPLSEEAEILRPERDWEGAGLPVRPSLIGATEFARELRDPFIFEDAGRTYMIYAGGGEAALGLAELHGM